MKKKIPTNKAKGLSPVVISTVTKNEFRKLCIIQDLKPGEVAQEMFKKWIAKNRKKVNLPFVANA